MRRIALILILLQAFGRGALADEPEVIAPPFNAPAMSPMIPEPMVLPTQGYCDRVIVYQSPYDSFYFRTETVAFRRDWESARTIATLGSPTNTVLGTHDLDFTMQPGLSVLIGRRLNPVFAVEAGFIGLLKWDESRTVQNSTINGLGTPGNLFSPFSHFGHPAQIGHDYNDFASIESTSQFNTAEINLRQRLNTPPSIMQASGIYGFRYMNIRERFNYQTQSFLPTPVGSDNAASVATNNNLYGLQVGGALDFQLAPQGWLNFEAKGIICRNGATESGQYTVGPIGGPGSTVDMGQNKSRTALGGDVQASAVWKFTPSIVARVGYQCIFINGLALPADNFVHNAPLIVTGHTEVVNTGHLAFHGPFAGLTVTW